MFFTRDHLKSALQLLERTRRENPQFCAQPRRDLDDNESFVGVGNVKVPYGTHGADFLEIDPVTGDIRCRACASSLVTATPKQIVKRGARQHAVSVNTKEK